MDWERPAFAEIKMDAEFSAYCDDLEDAVPTEHADSRPSCESAS